MPYDYRRMTPEQRAAVVAERRARGYPWHAPPHPYRGGGSFLITAACYEHQPILYTPERRDEFESRLLAAFHAIQAVIGGWVVGPTHYHILVTLPMLQAVSAALRDLHGTTARNWNRADGLTGERKVWYEWFDRSILNEWRYSQALNYIHYNPVKHHWASEPNAWRWSSVHLYADQQGSEWLRNQWERHPVGQMGRGWDD